MEMKKGSMFYLAQCICIRGKNFDFCVFFVLLRVWKKKVMMGVFLMD